MKLIDALKKQVCIIPQNEDEYNEVVGLLKSKNIICHYLVNSVPYSERQIIALWKEGVYCPTARVCGNKKTVAASVFIESNTELGKQIEL